MPPRFNQLLVFDPRLPHGVRPVEGTRDPRAARLVLHGWFTQPAPFFQGTCLLFHLTYFVVLLALSLRPLICAWVGYRVTGCCMAGGLSEEAATTMLNEALEPCYELFLFHLHTFLSPV